MACEINKDNAFIVLGQAIKALEDGKTYTVEIKEKKEKRSLQANNYSWTLTDKLSDKMVVAGVKLSKDEMHAEMIFRYGQPLLDGNGVAVIISAYTGINVPEFCEYAKEIGTGCVNGKEFTHWKIYRGTHTYDTKEMSIFISGIVEECKEQGIEVITDEELARLRYE